MRRIRLTVAYDGTNFRGSQVQPGQRTVESELNHALSVLTGEQTSVILASRTDSGVHAEGNVAVFDTEMRMHADRFAFALNDRLPDDLRIRKADEVPAGWHPRKQNCVKTYAYRIYNAKLPDPLVRLYSHFCYYDLDLEKMRTAAACLIGEHDFKSFCSADSQSENTVRTIYSLTLEKENDMILMRICGSGFLYNMVRIIMGTLMKIGTGLLKPEDMQQILRDRDRRSAGPNASAAGLVLERIAFETEPQPEIAAENEDWSYCLDQRELPEERRAFLLIRRCSERDYDGLVTRVLHQAWRNGAREIFVTDAEHPGRLGVGRTFGFYRLSGQADLKKNVSGVDISTWFYAKNL